MKKQISQDVYYAEAKRFIVVLGEVSKETLGMSGMGFEGGPGVRPAYAG